MALPEKQILQKLYERPGFMIRRAHQISVSIFTEACAEFGITPTQYGVMFILRHLPAMSQIELARLLGCDRSTASMVVRLLEQRGLLKKAENASDRREKLLTLTAEGRKFLARCQPAAASARKALLQPLLPQEQAEFLRLLSKLNDSLNERSRTPVKDF